MYSTEGIICSDRADGIFKMQIIQIPANSVEDEVLGEVSQLIKRRKKLN